MDIVQKTYNFAAKNAKPVGLVKQAQKPRAANVKQGGSFTAPLLLHLKKHACNPHKQRGTGIKHVIGAVFAYVAINT